MKSRGMTLIEMLVALALVAMVSSLLWQALGQVARWEAGLLRHSNDADEKRLQRAWVEQSLWGSVTGPDGDDFRFQGSSTELKTYTTAPPWPDTLGPDAMRMRVRVDATGHAHVEAWRLSDGKRFELWRWSAQQGAPQPEWRYLDHLGQWHSAWPPAAAASDPVLQQRELPLAVRLEGPPLPLLVALSSTRNPMLQRRNLVTDEAPVK